MDTKQLRLNGYIVDESGSILSDREGWRYAQERTAIILIEGGREIVDRLLAVADSPRALVGRSRDGAGLLLFRRDGESNYIPYIDNHRGIYDLVLNNNGAPLRLAFGISSLDPAAWSWPKGRSPADVSRDALPNVTGDVCMDIAREALALASDAKAAREEAERNREFEERRAKYLADLAKPKTAAQLQAEEDDEIMMRYANEVLAWDDPDKARLDAARSRIAARRKQTTAA